MIIKKNYIPNFITSLNMLSGFTSIILTTSHHYQLAILFIVIAAICDTLDGIFARLLKTSSNFGVQLDSLSDLVSFGVAPAYLVYSIKLNEFGIIGIIISGFFMLMGGFRLARFNSQLVGFDKDYFVGVPIPSGAILLLSYLYNFYIKENYNFDNNITLAYTVLISLMMVSKLRYPTLPKFNKLTKIQKIFYSILSLLLLFIIIITNGKFVFYIFVSYLLYGIIFYLKGKIHV